MAVQWPPAPLPSWVASAGKGQRIDLSRSGSLLTLTGVLAVLVTGGALAGAQSPRADDRPHLLLVPHTPEGRAALERGDARVIARYEEFTLAEAAGGDDARLRRAGADRRDDMREVSLPAAELDPRSERASLAAKEAPERDEALAVVQFIGPVKESWLERLEATGARVAQYAPQNAYVVHARGDALARVERLVGTDTAVRAVAPVRARDKVEDALTRGDSRHVAVQTIAGSAGADARRGALAAGPRVRAESEVGELRTQFLELDGAEAAALATDPAVVAIVPYGEPRLLDERAAQIVAGNLTSGGAPSGPGYLGWLAGKGFPSTTFDFTIDVSDEGLDNGSAAAPGHSDFFEDGSGSGLDRVTYATDYTSDPTATDCGGHGTNVASIAAGFGTTGSGRQDGAGFRHGMGVAPRARIGASKIFKCDGDYGYFGTFADLVSDAYAAGARISNNSWGFSDRGSYSMDSREYDALVRDAQPGVPGNQEMVEVFAAGNDGEGTGQGYASVGSPATAKNVIAVGASESVRAIGATDGCEASDAEADHADDIIDFSSRGPTDDLRLKPDLVAPGTHVVGAAPQHVAYDGNGVCNPQFPAGNTLYSLVSGSSQAAPEVAGAAALFRDWYGRGPGAGTPPSPALTKAILTNSATDLQGGDNGKGAAIEGAPNSDQGWGRVDMGEVLDSTIERKYYDQSAVFGSSGESFLRAYDVADAGRPLKVTLAWTDAPGMVDADALVNDLDLVVEAGGHDYQGNVFAGGQSITGGAPDTRNNLESVILPAGTSGRFAVKVVATNIAGDGVPGNPASADQDFALVVSNANEQAPSPVLVHEQTTIDDSAAGGDADGVLESDEVFELDEELRNAGDADATGVSGTLSGGSGVTIAQGSSTWPDLAAGATETNEPPSFAGKLSPGVSCGRDVTATLALTTDQGSQTVPLTLPTGVGAAPTPRTVSPALAIPDDSAAGVTSTLNVSTPGRIKDIDVHLAELDHTWVGDVRIDLTGPDGTTVNLVEHPGGPDNWTDDPSTPVVETNEAFVDTTFDDDVVPSISNGSEPYTGSFRPQNDQLSRFDGKQQQGTWTLRVRDLFEGDVGTLTSWGTDTSRAACDFDSSDPESDILSGPTGTVASDSASFTFNSNEDGATFECRLDGGAFAACSSPQSYTGLAEGTHTFEVAARDGTDNADQTPASRTWTVDLPPDTSIASGPSGATGSRDASFTFSSTQGGSSFECSLDGGPLSPCSSPHTLSGLSEGGHTLAVQARDQSGNLDPSAATYTWMVDVTPPALAVTAPATGQWLTGATPGLAGAAGTATGDAGTVTVKVWSGTLAAGLPAQTLVVPRDPASGAWTASPAAMGDGSWTVRAEQSDAVGNIGTSAPVTFGVDTTAPDFAIAPAEERLSDAVAGRLTVLAGCALACRVSAKLTVAARTARRLGLTAAARGTARNGARRAALAGTRATMGGPAAARSVSLGSSSARVSANAARALRVPLSRGARAALRGVRSLKATLSVHISGGARVVSLRRGITLHRRAGLRRIARSGLRLAGACSEACTLRGGLLIDAPTARRLGLTAPGGAPLTVASGTAPVSSTASRLNLRLTRSARRAVLRARRLTPTLEALVSGATGPEQRAVSRLTLRR
jgi:subtilisin-like proprotein convertase family protein